MHDFVNAINLRTSRFTNLAPNKVNKKDAHRLISFRAEQSLKLNQRLKLYLGDYVTLVKSRHTVSQGLQTIVVFDIPTQNPPAYNLIDNNRELIEGNFYESELIRVLEKEKS